MIGNVIELFVIVESSRYSLKALESDHVSLRLWTWVYGMQV